MTADEWLTCCEPKPLMGILLDRVSDRKMRLFLCALASASPGVRGHQTRKHGVEIAELVADGQVTDEVWQRARADLELLQEEAVNQNDYEEAALTRDAKVCLYPQQGDWFSWLSRHIDPLPENAELVREIFGNPFRPVALDTTLLTSDVVALATGIYGDRAFDRMPILADALQDAGCDNAGILNHCRDESQVHVRGCWIVDLILGKE